MDAQHIAGERSNAAAATAAIKVGECVDNEADVYALSHAFKRHNDLVHTRAGVGHFRCFHGHDADAVGKGFGVDNVDAVGSAETFGSDAHHISRRRERRCDRQTDDLTTTRKDRLKQRDHILEGWR